MKAKNFVLISCVVLLSITTAICAESESTDARPYMGVLLDTAPLPDLLIKHLSLSPGQGVRIRNVHSNSPADKAGLERDDIIIGFQGEDVKDYERFVNSVRKAGIGTEVSLEIIHLGKRKTVKFKLEPFKDEFDWKYTLEPEIVQSWRPGKMFRLKPGDKNWIEMKFPFDGKSLEVYHYQHSGDGGGYTITIEGDQDDEDTKITLRVGDKEYKTTVREIDKLPKKYRNIVEEALENSRKYSRQRKQTRKFSFLPSMPLPDEPWKHFRPQVPPFGSDDQMFDKIEKQVRKLQERIEELEKRFREGPERSSDEPDEQKSQRQEKSTPPKEKAQQRI